MSVNQQQSEAWNGTEAMHYVDHADRYDRQLAPFADAMLERAVLAADEAAPDIGCGCGATTIAAARQVRSALGVDISAPLLEIAADRARSAAVANAEFVVADAQTHGFADGAFAAGLSQFGLMFFDDPVAAFANLRRALAPGGRLVFVCWQGLEANEWVSIVGAAVARHVALPRLGGLAGGPGMFALADRDETAALLAAAGFGPVEVEPLAPTILLGGGGTLEEATDFLLGTGIARGLLGRLEPPAHAEAVEHVEVALAERYEPGVGVPVGAAGWLVSARGPAGSTA